MVVVPLMYTPTEAAVMLHVGKTTVYELMAGGQLRSIRIGRARRIPVEALEEFIEALARESA